MRKTWAVGVVAGALCGAPAWAIIKCTRPDGSVVYQEAPCAPGLAASQVNTSGAGAANPSSPGSQYWQREAARVDRLQRVNAAIAAGQIIIGMSAAEAETSWGRPTRINTSVGRYGRHEQWVYDRGNFRAQYVYVENGQVTSVQSSE